MASPALKPSIEQSRADEPLRPVTFEEYRALPDDGPRYELIGGVLYMSPAPKLIHQFVSGEIYARLRDHVNDHRLGLAMFAPFDVRFSEHNAVQPDVLFFSVANRRALGDDYGVGAPDLAIEVLSPSNRRVDLVLKRALYADNGVPEYWIVDPGKRTISVNRLHDGRYRETTHTGGTVEFQTLPGLVIDMATLFNVPDYMKPSSGSGEDEPKNEQ
jgi:Uma2 family endonuclease